MDRFPALFISHGSPMLAIEDSPARRFLASYGEALGRPRAIVVVSAHWETRSPAVSAAPRPETIHDFAGFPDALHRLGYPAAGAPDLAERIAGLMRDAGAPVTVHPTRGLDHGAWVPLMLLYPAHDVPVLQVSVQTQAGPEWHLRLGGILRPLRDEGVLIVGSGAMTHNLHAFFRGGYGPDSPAPAWVTGFADWMADAIGADRRDDLLAYRARAPHGAENHPTEEHLLPLVAALGAATPGGARSRVHASNSHGVLAMDAYAFA
ncbi:MAG: DODA-type extradiol aromatic ring-opening family dioxygenase [Rhodospirillales bacterium]